MQNMHVNQVATAACLLCSLDDVEICLVSVTGATPSGYKHVGPVRRQLQELDGVVPSGALDGVIVCPQDAIALTQHAIRRPAPGDAGNVDRFARAVSAHDAKAQASTVTDDSHLHHRVCLVRSCHLVTCGDILGQMSKVADEAATYWDI